MIKKMKNSSLKLVRLFLAAILVIGIVAIQIPLLLASTTGDFTKTDVPAGNAFPGDDDVLVFDIAIPDGTNNGATTPDDLLYDGGYTDWNGDALNAMGADDYFLDNGDLAWDETTEAVWIDADTDGRIDLGEIEVYGSADLTFFSAAGVNAEYVFDDFATDSPAGLTGADYDVGEAIWQDVDGDGVLGNADALIRDGTTAVRNFDTVTINPGGICGTGVGGCNGEPNIDDIYYCDVNGNGMYDGFIAVEGIFTDDVASNVLGDYDPVGPGVVDVLLSDPAGALAGAGSCALVNPGTSTPMSLTNLVAGPHGVVFLDADKSGSYGTAGGLGFGPPPATIGQGEVLIDVVVPIGDGTTLASANVVMIVPPDADISSNSGTSAYDTTVMDWALMNTAGTGDYMFIGTSDSADTFGGWEAIVDDSTPAGNFVLETGELLDGDVLSRGAVDSTLPNVTTHQNFTASESYSGTAPFDNSENIYDDVGTNAGTLDKEEDRLDDLTIQNLGTADDSDFDGINLWVDGGNGTFDAGATDDTLVGAGVWDGTNSWDFTTLSRAIPALGSQFFVSVDVDPASDGGTIRMRLPQLVDPGASGSYDSDDEGVFMASDNDGPTDGDIDNAAALTIPAQLTGTAVTLSEDRINLDVDFTISFTLASTLSDDGEVEITFPAEFDVSGLDTQTATGVTGLDGTLTASVAGQVVTFARGGGATAIAGGTDVSFTIGTGENGSTEGTTGDFIFRTLSSSGIVVDQDDSVNGVDLIAPSGAAGGGLFEEPSEPYTPSEPGAPADGIAAPFEDIAGHWAEDYIEELRLAGVVSGKTEGIFAPDDNVTRAEFVKMVLGALEISLGSYTESPFPDVLESDWFFNHVLTAEAKQIVSGYPDGTFGPNRNISRVEALRVLLEASGLDLTVSVDSVFPDTDENAWYADYLSYAVENSIVSGYENGMFGPSDNLTRAQAAKIIVLVMWMVD